MLVRRIITAAVLAAIILPTLLMGRVKEISILVAAFVLIGAWELATNLPGLGSYSSKIVLMFIVASILLLFYACPIIAVPAIIVFVPLVILGIHLFLYNVIDNTVESASQAIFVCAYLGIPLGHAILIARMANGGIWIIFFLVVVCLGDAGAYFGGKSLGRHRLSAHVSPSKTIEGLIGGVLGNLLGMVIMKLLAPNLPSIVVLFQLSILLAVVAPVGDLCASALKRRLKIKDFSSIMPGHGGVLDRADSLIPAAPAVFYFLVLSGYGTFL